MKRKINKRKKNFHKNVRKIINILQYRPSVLTTMVPTTPLWDWIRFIVSSTSLAWELEIKLHFESPHKILILYKAN